MRRRALVPLIIVLSLLTGATVGATASVFSAPMSAPATTPSTEALVRRFYTVANEVIRTGETAALDAVVAADVGLPAIEQGEESDRSTLAQRLVALHTAQPDLRLVVQDVIADRDTAVAWVAFEGETTGTLLALPSGDPATGRLDGFRIADGRIVETWGATVSLKTPLALLDATLDAPEVDSVFVGLSRLTIAPGTEVPEFVAPGPSVVTVETGNLTVHLNGVGLVRHTDGEAIGPEEPTVPGQGRALTAGDRLSVPTATAFVLRNEGRTAATVLVAALLPPPTERPVSPENAGTAGEIPAASVIFGSAGDGQDDVDARWPGGVTVERLVWHVVPFPQGGQVRLRVDRLVMAAGERVPGYRPSGPAVVAAVSGNALVVAAPVSDRAGAAGEVLQNGQAAEMVAGSPATISNVGAESAVLLILTLSPADAEPGPPA